MSASDQIPLRFPEALLSFDEMAITPANRAVITAVRRADKWPYQAFCLIGPSKSGLTTIANAWTAERAGLFLTPQDLSEVTAETIDHATSGSIAIDDADRITDGEILLRIISAAGRHGGRLLLTSHHSPSKWQASTKDLESRLRSAPSMTLSAPDEDLMRQRLRRSCQRAYLKLSPAVEDYLVTRLGLSFSLIEEAILRLDGAAAGRALTVPLAREVLSGEGWEE